MDFYVDKYSIAINIDINHNDQYLHSDNHNDCKRDRREHEITRIGNENYSRESLARVFVYSCWCRRKNDRRLPSIDTSVWSIHEEMIVSVDGDDYLLCL